MVTTRWKPKAKREILLFRWKVSASKYRNSKWKIDEDSNTKPTYLFIKTITQLSDIKPGSRSIWFLGCNLRYLWRASVASTCWATVWEEVRHLKCSNSIPHFRICIIGGGRRFGMGGKTVGGLGDGSSPAGSRGGAPVGSLGDAE